MEPRATTRPRTPRSPGNTVRARSGRGVELAVDRAQGAHLLLGVIGGADQRPTLHPGKANFHTKSLPLRKLLRRIVALDGQVFPGGLEVLPDRQNIHSPRTKISHNCSD